jgi:hypothetical protein
MGRCLDGEYARSIAKSELRRPARAAPVVPEIGAASGARVGTGVGAANAQNAAGYLQQQYNAY